MDYGTQVLDEDLKLDTRRPGPFRQLGLLGGERRVVHYRLVEHCAPQRRRQG